MCFLCNVRFYSQLIHVVPENIEERPWFFNEVYIRKNNIYKISFHILDKQDFQSPKDYNRTEVYEFDSLGRLFFSYTVQPVTSGLTSDNSFLNKEKGSIKEKNIYLTDTVFCLIAYDVTGRKKMERISNQQGVARTVYTDYFPDGKVRMMNCREWLGNASKKYALPDKQEIIYTDSFKTERPSDKFLKKIFFNSDGKVYKEWHYSYDGNRLMTFREIFITAPWIEHGTDIQYEEDRIRKVRIFANSGIPQETEYEYQYDEGKKLYSIYVRKNKYLQKEIGFVNDTTTGNPHSIVIRDYPSKSMQIIRIQVFSHRFPYVEK